MKDSENRNLESGSLSSRELEARQKAISNAASKSSLLEKSDYKLPPKEEEPKELESGIKEEELKEMDKAVKERVLETVKFAEESPFPEKSLMYDAVYEQEDYPFLEHKL